MSDELAVGLETLAAVFEMVLIVTACCRKNITRKPERYILCLFCSVFLMLLCDIGTYILWGKPEFIVLHKIIWFLDYVFVISYTIFLYHYLAYYIRERTKFSKKPTYVHDTFCTIGLVLWAVSMFNGMFFTFNENGEVIYGEWFLVSQLFVMFAGLFDGIIILKHRKFLGLRDTLSWLTYTVFSGVTIFFESKYEVVPVYLAMTVSTFIIYIMISLDQDRRLAEQRVQIAENQVKIMLSQIQPHFLFNSLTAIAQLCEKDPHMAKKTTIDFSEYLRMNMDSLNERGVIPFEKELEHTKTYVAIEQLRFGNKLQVDFDIQTTAFSIPPLTLQPIVENAVKHGIGKKVGGGIVTVSAKESNDCIEGHL